jgi:hypothetical protein
MVVKRGVNDNGIVEMAGRFRGTRHILRFIEYMDVGTTNGWRMEDVVPSREVVERIAKEWPVEPLNPNYFGEVAERYRYRDGAGEFGIISSVTQPFCGSCTRARLTADGKLYLCLFATEGHDLLRLVRHRATDEEFRRSARSGACATTATRDSIGRNAGRRSRCKRIGGWGRERPPRISSSFRPAMMTHFRLARCRPASVSVWSDRQPGRTEGLGRARGEFPKWAPIASSALGIRFGVDCRSRTGEMGTRSAAAQRLDFLDGRPDHRRTASVDRLARALPCDTRG